MNLIIDHILLIPIIGLVSNYCYNFYSHYYKTNRKTPDVTELLCSKIYMKSVLKK